MIFVECKPDFRLVQILLHISEENIAHELQGKGKVCSRLSEKDNSLALLDEDPQSPQPPYIRRMHLQNHVEAHDIKIVSDSNKHNFVILLVPKLEDWILRATKLVGLNIADYGLPNVSNELHRVVNSKLDKYESLLADLIKKHSPMLSALRQSLIQSVPKR